MPCNITELGTHGHCDILTTEIEFTDPGTYYLGYSDGGSTRMLELTIAQAGDPLVIPMQGLPVNRELFLHIYDEDQNLISVDGVVNIRLASEVQFTEDCECDTIVSDFSWTCLFDAPNPLPTYPSDVEADADPNLMPGDFYKLDGTVPGTLKNLVFQKS